MISKKPVLWMENQKPKWLYLEVAFAFMSLRKPKPGVGREWPHSCWWFSLIVCQGS